MENQQRTIVGTLDYSLTSLQNIKSALTNLNNPSKQMDWAVGGIIVTLVSNLIRTAQTTFLDSVENENCNARNDLISIKTEFNKFIERMLENE